jgi:ABC-type Fe3+/spermidine/putrescine transport system ATPase subunit
MTGEVVLELDRVTKRFGRVTAVDDVSERFVRGEYCCILGPSGCGKTTLLRLIAGFEQPDAGAIRMHGADVARVPPEKRDVNVVFQSYALFPHLSVRENVAFGLRMRKLARAESADRVRDALALVHLTAEAERLPRQLSGGQQQRVALARALVNRPSVLLLDEPLSALDMTLRRRMQDELRRIQRETGVTFLHITHDQAEALSMADRVVVLVEGRILQDAPPEEVYFRPATPQAARLLGTPAMNVLAARRVEGWWISATGARIAEAAPDTPERATIGFRPEHVDCEPGAGDATVEVVESLGSSTVVVLRWAGERIHALADRGLRVRPGEPITVRVDPSRVVVWPEARAVCSALPIEEPR